MLLIFLCGLHCFQGSLRNLNISGSLEKISKGQRWGRKRWYTALLPGAPWCSLSTQHFLETSALLRCSVCRSFQPITTSSPIRVTGIHSTTSLRRDSVRFLSHLLSVDPNPLGPYVLKGHALDTRVYLQISVSLCNWGPSWDCHCPRPTANTVALIGHGGQLCAFTDIDSGVHLSRNSRQENMVY